MKKHYNQPEVTVSHIETLSVICISLPKEEGGGNPLYAV